MNEWKRRTMKSTRKYNKAERIFEWSIVVAVVSGVCYGGLFIAKASLWLSVPFAVICMGSIFLGAIVSLFDTEAGQ